MLVNPRIISCAKTGDRCIPSKPSKDDILYAVSVSFFCSHGNWKTLFFRLYTVVLAIVGCPRSENQPRFLYTKITSQKSSGGITTFFINQRRHSNTTLYLFFRLVAAIWHSFLRSEFDRDPFTRGGSFWLVPLIVPYLGGLAALLVYNTLIVRSCHHNFTELNVLEQSERLERGDT
jgi:hypothetical protein